MKAMVRSDRHKKNGTETKVFPLVIVSLLSRNLESCLVSNKAAILFPKATPAPCKHQAKIQETESSAACAIWCNQSLNLMFFTITLNTWVHLKGFKYIHNTTNLQLVLLSLDGALHKKKKHSKASKSKVTGALRTAIPYIKHAKISAFSKK